MAEETQQEKEARWATHRAQRDTQQQTYRTARGRTTRRTYMGVGAIVILLVLLAAFMLM